MRVRIAAFNWDEHMAEIVTLADRKRKVKASEQADFPVIKKVVDGDVVECVNLDTLTPTQYSKYLSRFPDDKR